MYGIAIVFALATVNHRGVPVENHGKFADVKACEYAASIVEQNRHPLPAGHTIQCMRRAEVNVTASYTQETN